MSLQGNGQQLESGLCENAIDLTDLRIDYNSAFNTIVPTRLTGTLTELGLL